MADFLGIGSEIWTIFGFVFIVVAYLSFKAKGRDIPVKVLFLLKTKAGYLLSAKEDIAGVYIDIFKKRFGQNKKITSIGKSGLPVEVKIVPDKAKAYLISKDNGKPMVGYDIHLGGLQHMRLYATWEGLGETVDIFGGNNGESQNMHQTIINEELGASRELVRMVKEEVGIPMRTFIMMFGAGAGLAGTALFTILVLLGHLR